MKVILQNLLLPVTFVLATEIWFTLIGIDDLADYSEFIFQTNLSYTYGDKQRLEMGATL